MRRRPARNWTEEAGRVRAALRRAQPPAPPRRPEPEFGERRLSAAGLAISIVGVILLGIALSGVPRDLSVDPLLPAAVGALLLIIGGRILYEPPKAGRKPRLRR